MVNSIDNQPPVNISRIKGGQKKDKLEKKKDATPLKIKLSADPQMKFDSTPDMSDNIGSLHNVMHYGIDRAEKWTGLDQSRWGRLSTTVLLRSIATLYANGLYHELGGHGAKYREFGCTPPHNMTPPNFGQIPKDNEAHNICKARLNQTQRVVATANGPNATQFKAQDIISNAVADGSLGLSQAMAYLFAKLDYASYSVRYFGLFGRFGDGGGDLAGYYTGMAYKHLDDLEQKYGITQVSTRNLWDGTPNFPLHALTAGAIWTLLDPALYYSFKSTLSYIWSGKRDVTLPRIMPVPHFIMSTDGPEFRLVTHFRTKALKNTALSPYLGVTATHNDRSYTFGGSLTDLQVWRFSLNGTFDVWKRPAGWGGGAGVELLYRLTNSLWIMDSPSLGGRMKCKTGGHNFVDRLEAGCSGSFILATDV